MFGCRGREFGSLSRGVLGISNGIEGVQWNAGYHSRDGTTRLGVSREGMKYDDWPVARLIERELSRPLLLTRYRRSVARPPGPQAAPSGYRKVAVTLLPSERRVAMPVTPHLQFETRLARIPPHEMRQARDNREGLHEFAGCRSNPHDHRGRVLVRAGPPAP